MSETTDYSKVYLDPKKNVEVPIHIWSTVVKVIKQVENENKTQTTKDVYTWYHNETHNPINGATQKKLSEEELNLKYYRNIDMDKTKANIEISRDGSGLSLVCLELLGAFDHVFKLNIDNGNSMPIPDPNLPTGPAPMTVVATDSKDES
tara:strand:+ start:267 stop:713 length:447 start_codon:yes stop_codon:yes gene_type:complete